MYHLCEENTNFTEGLLFKSTFEKIHHIPRWENSLLRQSQLHLNLFMHLMQFHSTAQNPKRKSARGQGGLPKIILKFTQKNKHERADKKVLAFLSSMPPHPNHFQDLKITAWLRTMHQLISINLRWSYLVQTKHFPLIRYTASE